MISMLAAAQADEVRQTNSAITRTAGLENDITMEFARIVIALHSNTLNNPMRRFIGTAKKPLGFSNSDACKRP